MSVVGKCGLLFIKFCLKPLTVCLETNTRRAGEDPELYVNLPYWPKFTEFLKILEMGFRLNSSLYRGILTNKF